MLSIYLDCRKFGPEEAFHQEVRRFIEFVKSAEKIDPSGQILVPGEIEEQTRARRLADGIELDETTWGQILTACNELGISSQEVP
jgi:uncharacterized oxidoreductase